MLKIIGLYGAAETGKTTTLNTFASDLEEKYDSKPLKQIQSADLSLDNRYCFRIDREGKLSYVVVTTFGDTFFTEQDNRVFLEKSVPSIETSDCYWFVATRTKGHTCEYIESIAKQYSAELVWITKGYVYDFDKPVFEKIKNMVIQQASDSLMSILDSYIQ